MKFEIIVPVKMFFQQQIHNIYPCLRFKFHKDELNNLTVQIDT